MQNHLLVYPMFALVLLTASTLIRLLIKRVKAVRTGRLNAGYFSTYNAERTGGEPDLHVQLSRNFSNLLESPTLFYVACLVAMIAVSDSNAILMTAWVYVGTRACHTWIHTTTNRLGHRMAAYFGSWAILLLLWAMIGFEVAAAGWNTAD